MCVCCVNAGRGFKSHAYTHSVQEGHHVFLNLETMKFYCLPDNYHIIDQSLEDIVVSHSSDFHLSVCLSLCLSLCPSLCLSVSLSTVYSFHQHCDCCIMLCRLLKL